jgi:hypothetical protein
MRSRLWGVVLLGILGFGAYGAWSRLGRVDLESCVPESSLGRGDVWIQAERPVSEKWFARLECLAPLAPEALSGPIGAAARAGREVTDLLGPSTERLLFGRSASGAVRAALFVRGNADEVQWRLRSRGTAAGEGLFRVRAAGTLLFGSLRSVRGGNLLLLAPTREDLAAMETARSKGKGIDLERRTDPKNFLLVRGEGRDPLFEVGFLGDESDEHYSLYRAPAADPSAEEPEEYKGEDLPPLGGNLAALWATDVALLPDGTGGLGAVLRRILSPGDPLPGKGEDFRAVGARRFVAAVLRVGDRLAPVLLLQAPEGAALDGTAARWSAAWGLTGTGGADRVWGRRDPPLVVARRGESLVVAPLPPEALGAKTGIPLGIRDLPAPRDRLDLILLGGEPEAARLLADLAASAAPRSGLAMRLAGLADRAAGTEYVFGRIVTPERGNLSLVRTPAGK